MKNFKCIAFIAILISSFFLSSCGETKQNSGDFPLKVETTINSALSESYEITNSILRIEESSLGSKLLVEIKRTSIDLPFDVNDAQLCGTKADKTFEWCITADILDANGTPIETNLAVYDRKPFEDALTLKPKETIWLEFSLSWESKLKTDASIASSVKLKSSVETMKTLSANEDWNDILISYENYINTYIKLMKKAKAGDTSIMNDYEEALSGANNLATKLASAENSMTSSQIQKFAQLQTKFTNAAMSL